jgi:polysaccharide export outer membrane protein
MNARKWAGRLGAVWALILIGILAVGCKTSNPDPASTQFSDVAGGPAAGAGTASPPATPGLPSPGSTPTTARGIPPASEAPNPSDHLIRVSDLIKVVFADLPMSVLPFEGRVKDDGTITLILNKTFQVVGKTPGQVEKEIRDRYVPRLFTYMTVTVQVSDIEGSRYYYVGGEVKTPGAKPYVARIKLLEAIQAAGDFTEYARRSGVTVTRGGKKYKIDCKAAARKRPELNIEILPDDRIDVPKSPF